MRMDEFVYHRPATLAEAYALFHELEGKALFFAGGTDLLPDFKRGKENVRHLISLTRLDELRGIRVEEGALVIGALSSLAEVEASELVREHFPPLAEAAAMLGGVQVRHQATIGGNLCRAVPCADTPPICLVAEAELQLVTPSGKRVVPLDGFFAGKRQTILEKGELLEALRIPPQPKGSGASYQRYALRGGLALAVASVAARVVLSGGKTAGARVALGAVSPVPMLVPESGGIVAGSPPGDEVFAKAAAAAAEAAQPISDIRGSAEYRREIVDVLTRRALARATRRAEGKRDYSWECR